MKHVATETKPFHQNTEASAFEVSSDIGISKQHSPDNSERQIEEVAIDDIDHLHHRNRRQSGSRTTDTTRDGDDSRYDAVVDGRQE